MNEIDLKHAYAAMAEFLSHYRDQKDPGFDIKIRHTWHVVKFASMIAEAEGFTKNDRDLACLIALLHDIGRFEELRIRREFNSAAFDHASLGVKMLKDGLLRNFIEEDAYDEIILNSIAMHSLYRLPEIRDEKILLHAQLLRDADKLDNFRIRAEAPVAEMFGNLFHDEREMADSLISEEIMNALRNHRCADVRDRKTPLDYYVTVIGFWFDLSFASSRRIAKENRWIETMVHRFDFSHETVRKQMAEILCLLEI